MSDPHAPEDHGFADLAAAWQRQVAGADRIAEVDVGKLRQRAHRFGRTIRFRNARELVACLVVAGIGASFIHGASGVFDQVTGLTWIACSLWIGWVLVRRGGNAPPPPPAASAREVRETLRAELERQAALLHDVWRWYLLPCVPPMLMVHAGTLHARMAAAGEGDGGAPLTPLAVMALVVIAEGLLFWFLHWLNRRAARRLRAEAARLFDEPEPAGLTS